MGGSTDNNDLSYETTVESSLRVQVFSDRHPVSIRTCMHEPLRTGSFEQVHIDRHWGFIWLVQWLIDGCSAYTYMINTISKFWSSSPQVHMNMGNVMGSVDWISKDFRSSARLSIASTGHKKVSIQSCVKQAVEKRTADVCLCQSVNQLQNNQKIAKLVLSSTAWLRKIRNVPTISKHNYLPPPFYRVRLTSSGAIKCFRGQQGGHHLWQNWWRDDWAISEIARWPLLSASLAHNRVEMIFKICDSDSDMTPANLTKEWAPVTPTLISAPKLEC